MKIAMRIFLICFKGLSHPPQAHRENVSGSSNQKQGSDVRRMHGRDSGR
nr:MAG TPA_asm: hypothetical protein [Caudoviricetes sp.]